MVKVLKWGAIVLGAILLIASAAVFIMSETEPKGTNPNQADELADLMMASVNKPAWDTTLAVQWTFMGRHDYVWDRGRDYVQVKWDDFRVLLRTKDQTGVAYKGDERLEGSDLNDALEKAWSNFCNDSFWLNAVVKAKDPGTIRSIVTTEDGRQGLKVAYTSGGVTPGDSYVWILDEDHRPTSYKMWVKILPIGGMEVSWENWTQLPTGAWIAQNHKTGKMDVTITNLEAASQLDQLEGQTQIFDELAL